LLKRCRDSQLAAAAGGLADNQALSVEDLNPFPDVFPGSIYQAWTAREILVRDPSKR
jgi:hypothetical protein